MTSGLGLCSFSKFSLIYSGCYISLIGFVLVTINCVANVGRVGFSFAGRGSQSFLQNTLAIFPFVAVLLFQSLGYLRSGM